MTLCVSHSACVQVWSNVIFCRSGIPGSKCEYTGNFARLPSICIFKFHFRKPIILRKRSKLGIVGLALEPEMSGFEGSLYYLSTMSIWVRGLLWASVLWLQTILEPPSSAKTLFNCPVAKWTPPFVCPMSSNSTIQSKLTICPLSWILCHILHSSRDAETWEFSSAVSFSPPSQSSYQILTTLRLHNFLESISSFILVHPVPNQLQVKSFQLDCYKKRPG